MREFSKIYIYLRPWEIALVRYDVPLPWPKPCRSITMASTSPITLEYFHFNFLVAIIPCSFAKLGQSSKLTAEYIVHRSALSAPMVKNCSIFFISAPEWRQLSGSQKNSVYVTTPCNAERMMDVSWVKVASTLNSPVHHPKLNLENIVYGLTIIIHINSIDISEVETLQTTSRGQKLCNESQTEEKSTKEWFDFKYYNLQSIIPHYWNDICTSWRSIKGLHLPPQPPTTLPSSRIWELSRQGTHTAS